MSSEINNIQQAISEIGAISLIFVLPNPCYIWSNKYNGSGDVKI